MICDNIKYKNFVALLSVVGIFIHEYSNTDNSYFKNKNISNYSTEKISTIEYSTIHNISNDDAEANNETINRSELISIAKKHSPKDVKIEDIEIEYINDELEKLTVVKVYLDFAKQIEDEVYFKAEESAAQDTALKNILVRFL